jgi:hypothetical protein
MNLTEKTALLEEIARLLEESNVTMWISPPGRSELSVVQALRELADDLNREDAEADESGVTLLQPVRVRVRSGEPTLLIGSDGISVAVKDIVAVGVKS